MIAEAEAIAAARAADVGSAAWLGGVSGLSHAGPSRGRRGPGQPGSAKPADGVFDGPAAGFAAGHCLDVAPGSSGLMSMAEDAAGSNHTYRGVTDDELAGLISAWDRVSSTAAARKCTAIAELTRRRPPPAGEPGWEEFTDDELSQVLAETRAEAAILLDMSQALTTRLPGTYAAFRDGVLTEKKVRIIYYATLRLSEQQSRRAEDMVLRRAGRLTPPGLRAAIARAVMEVAPKSAQKRREEARKTARVERWPEQSGNAGLAGRELHPAQALAADQRITWWAQQLKAAGIKGDMDQLRARAYVDILLGIDSRPRTTVRAAVGEPAEPGFPAPRGPLDGMIPPGFAGQANLTIPLATLLGLANRPGELGSMGPVDPGLARDLADAAARNPKTTWCVTVTDEAGHAVGHGCARPARSARAFPADSHGPPRPAGFAVTARGQPGPPCGYGSWILSTPGGDLTVMLDPVAIDDCDHRFQAKGRNPGTLLRHLTQIRHGTCVSPTCRRPAARCEFEHNTPYEQGGRTGPACATADLNARHDHRMKQHPRWKVDQPTPGTFRWTTPAGRSYDTEPTRYPI